MVGFGNLAQGSVSGHLKARHLVRRKVAEDFVLALKLARRRFAPPTVVAVRVLIDTQSTAGYWRLPYHHKIIGAFSLARS